MNEALEAIKPCTQPITHGITLQRHSGLHDKDRMILLQAHEGMDALVFNLRQEHVVICDFVSTFHQVWSTSHQLSLGVRFRCEGCVNILRAHSCHPALNSCCDRYSSALHASTSRAGLMLPIHRDVPAMSLNRWS